LCSLADTHCHLDFNLFDTDRESVLERARESGVVRILNPGIDLGSSRKAISIADLNNDLYAAVGVHPNDASTWEVQSLSDLRKLTDHPKVVAIGEIGLDYYRMRTPPDFQKHVFQDQLELAAELSLPVVIHNREATLDLMTIISSWVVELRKVGSTLSEHPGVLHSYSADFHTAMQAISLGFYIGFTGPITFRKAEDLRLVAAGIPLEAILVETDAPFLTPEPHRGKRNEPAYVGRVADKIAELQKISQDKAYEATFANSKKLFRW
jgi:TatD DNase family protein